MCYTLLNFRKKGENSRKKSQKNTVELLTKRSAMFYNTIGKTGTDFFKTEQRKNLKRGNKKWLVRKTKRNP